MQYWGINKAGNQFTELCSDTLTALTQKTVILAYQSELQEEDQSGSISQQKIVMGT